MCNIRIIGILSICAVLFWVPCVYAELYTTNYEYDNLYRLTRSEVVADVHGKGLRVLSYTTYQYDKNGNRIGMARQAGTPAIDNVEVLGQSGNTITLRIYGFAFQQGMQISLTLTDCGQVAGTIIEVTPTYAVVEFEICDTTDGAAYLHATMPDTQSTDSTFDLNAPAGVPLSPWILVITLGVMGLATLLFSKRTRAFRH